MDWSQIKSWKEIPEDIRRKARDERERFEHEQAERDEDETAYSIASWVMMLSGLLLLIIALALPGCVVGPDGRRTLSPGARAAGEAMLQHVLTCGLQAGLGAAASAAANGGAPSEQVLLEASRCHIQLATEQAKRALAPKPSVDHGRRMLEAQTLHDAGLRDEAIEVARECDKQARGAR